MKLLRSITTLATLLLVACGGKENPSTGLGSATLAGDLAIIPNVSYAWPVGGDSPSARGGELEIDMVDYNFGPTPDVCGASVTPGEQLPFGNAIRIHLANTKETGSSIVGVGTYELYNPLPFGDASVPGPTNGYLEVYPAIYEPGDDASIEYATSGTVTVNSAGTSYVGSISAIFTTDDGGEDLLSGTFDVPYCP